MSNSKRRLFTPDQKAEIVRRHLSGKEPVSKLRELSVRQKKGRGIRVARKRHPPCFNEPDVLVEACTCRVRLAFAGGLQRTLETPSAEAKTDVEIAGRCNRHQFEFGEIAVGVLPINLPT